MGHRIELLRPAVRKDPQGPQRHPEFGAYSEELTRLQRSLAIRPQATS